MSDQPSFLLTGATGYIGSHLARRLVQSGYRVHILVRRGSKLDLLGTARSSVQIHPYDGTAASLLKLFAETPIDIVVHLASLASVTHSLTNFESMLQSNIIFGTQLAEAMNAHRVPYLINTGTYSQHYNNEDYNPQSLYAATKQAFDDILVYYTEAASLCCTTLELFDSYGPNDPRPKIIPLLIEAYRSGNILAMSPGEQLLDLVYIGDIVDAYVAAAERLLEGRAAGMERFVVATRQPLSLKELVEKLENVTQSKLPIKWGERGYRNREIMIPWNKGVLLPGWQAATPIEKGLGLCVRAAVRE
ncbi:NAD-dependent epimerase/dehydratase family protein [Paenibacillus harenae]|uniref:Nucleoside-diphosphate-sugar epimerase n=1 Tax=Paenibacillus harenae TaxID=306543 RepID=A0ABT9U7G7_PAEHA|nr:NAD(P)-dependent oxidoreductase [Paenibacillus harenae]MDQ0114389.1 nucleoside-diphosphate-sugar epimerase [Paenibacillus harenae]